MKKKTKQRISAWAAGLLSVMLALQPLEIFAEDGIQAAATFTPFGHLIIENEMFELYIQIKNDQDYQVL